MLTVLQAVVAKAQEDGAFRSDVTPRFAALAFYGIIEQVRIRDYPFGLGVQYHPERDMSYAPLFDDFLSRLT